MEHKHIVVAVVILGLLLVGMFVFTYLKKIELQNEEISTPIPLETNETQYGYITRIDAKHFFIDGEHTVVGEILMPTPCDLLNWDTTIQESFPETVTIDFSIINNAEVCAQVVTAQRFKVSFDASADATIRATLEGRILEVNLIPALPDESPDDFEVFIKG